MRFDMEVGRLRVTLYGEITDERIDRELRTMARRADQLAPIPPRRERIYRMEDPIDGLLRR